MMLRGMGFDNKTSIYLASGKIYEEEKHLAPLLMMFPQLRTKESLASADELAPFQVQLNSLVRIVREYRMLLKMLLEFFDSKY